MKTDAPRMPDAYAGRMPDAYANRMHAAYAEQNRTEQNTYEEVLVTTRGNLSFRNAREKSPIHG